MYGWHLCNYLILTLWLESYLVGSFKCTYTHMQTAHSFWEDIGVLWNVCSKVDLDFMFPFSLHLGIEKDWGSQRLKIIFAFNLILLILFYFHFYNYVFCILRKAVLKWLFAHFIINLQCASSYLLNLFKLMFIQYCDNIF